MSNTPPAPPVRLHGANRADIAIIGAGLTGLWTALFLRQLDPGCAITVIDQGRAAYGASGRNAGMLAETIDHSHSLAIEHFGPEEAQRLAQLGRQNLDALCSFLREEQIDCDFTPSGRLLVALADAHRAGFEAEAEAAARLGIHDYHLLDAAATRAELDSPLYRGGLWVPSGGVLDPVKLVEGLRRAALRRGIEIREESRVLGLDDLGRSVLLRAEHGTLQAERVVVAASAYTHQLLPEVRWRFLPLYDYIIASEPLTPSQLASLGWRRRQGVTDGRNFFLYYRLTADNRVIWGTSEAVYHGNNQVGPACDHSEDHYRRLRESFAQHFPQLGSLRFPFAWGGAICATTRLTPFFGASLRGKVRYGLGFTGHGLGSTRLAGKILAHLTLTAPDELLSLRLAQKKPLPYPPEPLRGLAVSWVSRDLRRVDQGHPPSLLLRVLARLGIGFSS